MTQVDGIAESKLKLTETKEAIMLIDMRLSAIHEKKLDAEIIPWAYVNDGSEYEINYLTRLREEKQKEMENYTQPNIDYLSIVLHANEHFKSILFVLGVAMSICSFCLIKGYSGWRRNQKTSDEILIIEHDIKKTSLKLLQLEVNQKINSTSDNHTQNT